MNRIWRSGLRWLSLFGIDPRKTLRTLRRLPWYLRDLRELKRQRGAAAREFPLGKYYPCLEDKSPAGLAQGHYFHQDLLVARRIHQCAPAIHADVGSRVDGFVAHVASFRPIDVFDLRPLPAAIPNVKFVQMDLMAPLDERYVDYCDSLSCLHALEHFGLGRYGDRVIYDGYLLALANLRRMLKRGGRLYLSVPIGPQRIEFNAHRVFAVDYLLECLKGRFQADQFSYVDDRGDLHENVSMTGADAQNNFGCFYGCGIFELTKPHE